jgi:hypothetical protein
MWLSSPDTLPLDLWRPDRLGLIFDLQPLPSGRRVIRAMEVWPGAATTGDGWQLVLAMGKATAVSVVRYGDPVASVVARPDGRGRVQVLHRPTPATAGGSHRPTAPTDSSEPLSGPLELKP